MLNKVGEAASAVKELKSKGKEMEKRLMKFKRVDTSRNTRKPGE